MFCEGCGQAAISTTKAGRPICPDCIDEGYGDECHAPAIGEGSQMSDELEITDADREAAVAVLGGAAPDGLIEGRKDDLSIVQAFARHRIAAEQRGKLEGARLALEAAATVAPNKTPSGECETVGQWTRRTLREAIRALDPAKIVGEG